MWRNILKRCSVFVQRRCRTKLGQVWRKTMVSSASVTSNRRGTNASKRGPHEKVFQTWVQCYTDCFPLSTQRQPVPTLMRRSEHLSRLSSAGHYRRKLLCFRRTCGQSALQLFNLRHLLDTFGRIANDLYMASRNFLDLISKPLTFAALFEA